MLKSNFSNDSRRKNLILLGALLLAAGILITYLARVYFQFPYCPSDEVSYLNILAVLDSGNTWPVSGPGFVKVVQIISQTTEKELAVADLVFGVTVSCVYPLLLFYVYRQFINNDVLALFAVVSALMSSYFLAPMIEIRPQQLGMLLITTPVFLVFRKSQSIWSLLSISLLLILIFYYHLLTFAVLSGVLAMYIYAEPVPLCKNKIFLMFLISVTTAVSLALFFEFYDIMAGDITNVQLKNTSITIGIFLLLACSALLTRRFILRYFEHFIDLFMSIPSKYRLLLVFFVIILTLLIQIVFLPEGNLSPFNNSILKFFFLEAGNIFFGSLFIVAVCLPNDSLGMEVERIRKISLFFLILGLGALIMSFFMFNSNWMLRIINYWTVFAAPLCGIVLYRLYLGAPLVVVPIILSAIVISLLHAVKHPALMVCA